MNKTSQEILPIIELFSSQSKINFYSKLFDELDLSGIKNYSDSFLGRIGFSQHALVRSLIVMKTENISFITNLLDFLNNNLKIAHLCGFDILKSLPSPWTYYKYLKNTLENSEIKNLMQNLVLELKTANVISGKNISMDSTCIKANVKNNNPKNFQKNKFDPKRQPKNDKNCKIGVTASNNENRKGAKQEFYWGYKDHILLDADSGLPIDHETTRANVHDSKKAISILSRAHSRFDFKNFNFIGDKGYDANKIYNFVHKKLKGMAYIPLKRTKKTRLGLSDDGTPICQAGLLMKNAGVCCDYSKSGKKILRERRKFRCPVLLSIKRLRNGESCPVNHDKFYNGKNKNLLGYGCTTYIDFKDNFRHFFNRDSRRFKKIYKLRTGSERYNARFKMLDFEDASLTNFASIQNLNTLGHITLLLVAKAAVKQYKPELIRSLVKLKRAA